ncbi:acetyl-CoA carboxylase biotin carboxyl carrier protein [Streptococcus hongkongensis]|nr:acetyl-CoA carboxylase [Streptococcus uberis]
MDIQIVKDLMTQFDESGLREFSFKTNETEISFSKNDSKASENTTVLAKAVEAPVAKEIDVTREAPQTTSTPVDNSLAEGEVVNSPLVGVAYLSSAPGKENFVAVGDKVKKGQTLLIIEAMKVMNEVPAPSDGTITEILVANEELVEFGKGLVRIK